MNTFTKDPSTHPANGPLTEDRLIRVREWLQSSLEYSEGSNRDYMMADAAKAIDEALALRKAGQEPVGYYRLAEDGVSYYLSSPGQQRDGTIPLYAAPQLPQPAMASDEMINTFEAEFRRAFEVSDGVEQLIEIDYQGEKFSLSIRDAATWWKLGRAAILKYSAPFIVTSDRCMMEMPKAEDIDAVAAMLQGAGPVSQPYTLREGVASIRSLGPIDAEKIQAERDALNESDMPDGYALVPVEPTAEMVKKMRYHCGGYDKNIKDGYKAMLAAAPQQEAE